MRPTNEQAAIVSEASSGNPMKVKAFAGSGKTASMELIANALPNKKILYLAFNKSTAQEAKSKMPKNCDCQPNGTLVTVPVTDWHASTSKQVPIETLRDGDKVVSYNSAHGGPVVRKRGQEIKVHKRTFDGNLITATTGIHASKYTPEHPCMVMMDGKLDGDYLLYMMKKEGYYRLGVANWTTWDSRNGLAVRAKQEKAEAVWVLETFHTKDQALKEEAYYQFVCGIPGWSFVKHERRTNGLVALWSRIEKNKARASACLERFGRDIERPLWEYDGKEMGFNRSPRKIAACNLVSGMKMLPLNNSKPKRSGGDNFGRLVFSSECWEPIEVGTEHYTGEVTSLEVKEDHTYFADGLLTHNCRTAHSLAFKPAVIGHFGKSRLDEGGDNQVVQHIENDPKVLPVMKIRDDKNTTAAFIILKTITRFCQSAESLISPSHVPSSFFAGIEKDGDKKRAAKVVADQAQKVWEDIIVKDSHIPITFDFYLKWWALAGPTLPYDVILFDEAQDASPVMFDITQPQHAQQVYVGDSWQSIYKWRNAIDAMKKAPGKELTLSQSFRFGPEIASQANELLSILGEEDEITGVGPQGSVHDDPFKHMSEKATLLCRSNAGVVSETVEALDRNKKVGVVGGTYDATNMMYGAYDLYQGKTTDHPDFRMFSDWDALVEFTKGEEGGSYKPIVKMVERYSHGIPNLCRKLRYETVKPHEANIVVSTAHKAKGGQWDEVHLSEDFPDLVYLADDNSYKLDEDEGNLMYVAATRAKTRLNMAGYAAWIKLWKAQLNGEMPQQLKLPDNVTSLF